MIHNEIESIGRDKQPTLCTEELRFSFASRVEAAFKLPLYHARGPFNKEPIPSTVVKIPITSGIV